MFIPPATRPRQQPARWAPLSQAWQRRLCALLCLATGHCAHPGVRAQSGRDNAILAQVGNSLLHEGDLPEATQKRLFQLDNTYAQQRFATLWTGVEDALGDQLLEAEAQRRHLPLAKLMASEVDEKIGVASEAELQEVYASHQARIGIPFAEAEPYLREQVLREREQTLRRALVDRLRARQEVVLHLPLPELRRVAVAVDPRSPAMGPKDARATLVVFVDFQCPYSAQARRLVKRLTELYPKDLQVVVRQFPLEQHAAAMKAAEASLCAQAQGRFWPMYEILFENIAHLEAATLPGYADLAQLHAGAFQACMAEGKVHTAVQADILEGQLLGIQGTPAMYLNGMPLMGVLPLPVMQALVARELGLPN